VFGVVVIAVLLTLLIACAAAVCAAKTAPAKKTPAVVSQPTMAILPLQVEKAKKGTKADLLGIYKALCDENGVDAVSGIPVERAMRNKGVRTEGPLSQNEVVRVGRAIGTDYAMFATQSFSTRRGIMMTKAKSTVTLEIMIVDVRRGTIAFSYDSEVRKRGRSKDGATMEKKAAKQVIEDALKPFFNRLAGK
jgi:hypothetical protein